MHWTVLLALTACVDIAEASPRESGFAVSDFVGHDVCEVRNSMGVSSYDVPFFKDPSAMEFSLMYSDSKAVVLVIRRVPTSNCGKILSALDVSQLDVARGSKKRIEFNCAAIDERFARSLGYFGIIPGDDHEFTQATVAWSVDVDSGSFKTLANPHRVYCPNFIAD